MPQLALRMGGTKHPAVSKPIPNWRTQQCGVRVKEKRVVENEAYGATVSAFDLSTVQSCIKHCLSYCIISHPTQGCIRCVSGKDLGGSGIYASTITQLNGTLLDSCDPQ
jgi:hypothetical protein